MGNEALSFCQKWFLVNSQHNWLIILKTGEIIIQALSTVGVIVSINYN